MTDFVIGCTHFGHENIIRLTGRPFGSVEEMNDIMVEKWNQVVRSTDTVFHLGDFAFRGDAPETYLSRLNGQVVRIRGNHDAGDWGVDYMRIKRLQRQWVLFHYPIEEWDGWFRGSIHLHCHTHKPDLVSAPRRFNVGADALGFRPIALEELITHPNAQVAA